jgi:hypothetical protein
MCNAYNHPTGCRCGWGGDGHLGTSSGYSGYVYTSLYRSPDVQYFSEIPSFNPSYTSFVNPNAHCPVCGTPVFFYQSPYGGRVFFDELGPPWPKHPCTDTTVLNYERPIQKYLKASSRRLYTWQKDSWRPFECVNAYSMIQGRTVLEGYILSDYEYYGTSRKRLYRFYLKGDHIYLQHQPLLIRPVAHASFEFELAT